MESLGALVGYRGASSRTGKWRERGQDSVAGGTQGGLQTRPALVMRTGVRTITMKATDTRPMDL